MADIQDYFSRRAALRRIFAQGEYPTTVSDKGVYCSAGKKVRLIRRAEEEVSVWGIEHD